MGKEKLFSKGILAEGQYVSPDGRVDVTRERNAHWVETARQMIGNGLSLPVHWDHADNPEDATPLWKEEFEKRKERGSWNAIGKLADARLAENGQMEILLDVHDEVAAKKAENNTVQISPVIYDNWKDGRGREYTDCMTHFDFVVHPVDDSQTPFNVITSRDEWESSSQPAVSLSLRFGSLGETTPSRAYRFSGAPNMATSNSLKRKRLAEDEEDTSVDSADELDYSEGDDEHKAEGGGGDGELKSLCEQVMGALDAEVPTAYDPLTEEGFALVMTAILNAIKGKEKAEGEGEMEDSGEAGMGDDYGEAEAAPPDIAAFSLDNPKNPPVLKAMLSQMTHDTRMSLVDRARKCFERGAMSPAKLKETKEVAGKVSLSVDGKGRRVKSEVEREIEFHESLPDGALWDPARRLSEIGSVEVPHPPEVTGGDDDRDPDEVIRELYKREPAKAGS